MPKITPHKREERQRQILDAALSCFSENGFHQTSMPDIVRRSGLSHGAVYIYFKSKDDIILALAVDRHRQEAILNAVASGSCDPREGLRALIRGYARSLADPAGNTRRRVSVNGWAEALRDDRVLNPVVEGIEAPIAVVVTLAERARNQGRFPTGIDAKALGRALVALFQGFTLQVVWGQAVDIEAAIDVIERMVLCLFEQGSCATRRRSEVR